MQLELGFLSSATSTEVAQSYVKLCRLLIKKKLENSRVIPKILHELLLFQIRSTLEMFGFVFFLNIIRFLSVGSV